MNVTQVNILEAKNELSKLIRKLESGEEDDIVIARNGVPVVRMVLYVQNTQKSVIGAAKGKFNCPDEMNAYDDEITEMFGGEI